MHLCKKGEKLNNHTVFVDNEEELEKFDAAEEFDTPKEIMESMPFNRLTKKQLASAPVFVAGAEAIGLDPSTPAAEMKPLTRKQKKRLEKIDKQRKKSYEELQQRMEREKKLAGLLQEANLKKNLMVCIFTLIFSIRLLLCLFDF